MTGSYAADDNWRDKTSQTVPRRMPSEVPKDTSLYLFVTTVKKITSCVILDNDQLDTHLLYFTIRLL